MDKEKNENQAFQRPKRKFSGYFIVGLKGMAMGAFDVVPGVSGGTIAFISGIYEELINAIKSVNLKAIKKLLKEGVASFWNSINANFLLALGIGILISIYFLSGLLHHLLETQPILVWSFFFGLIISSAIVIAAKITKWNIATIMALIIGAIAAFFITTISPVDNSDNASWLFIFLSGALAICAMILPGISGSFILVLLGMYKFILGAVSELKFLVISVFAAGAVTGLLSFSNLLSWLLRKYHNITIAVLAGFMLGSLNKVWPWKKVVEWTVDRHGDTIPVDQANVLPHTYSQLQSDQVLGNNTDSQLLWAVVLAIIGFVIIFVFEKFSVSKKAETEQV